MHVNMEMRQQPSEEPYGNKKYIYNDAEGARSTGMSWKHR